MASPLLPAHGQTLIGAGVRLDPLSIEDLRELAPLLRVPEVFAGGHAGGPAAMPDTDEGYVEFFADYCPMYRGGRSYIVRRHGGAGDGDPLGTTSLYDYRPEIASVAIGYTAYAPAVWGTSVNPDAKRCLLESAFDAGFARVQFHVAAVNERSRAAVTRLGAHLDGVLRSDRLRADGVIGDTAVFSILAAEWPGVRAGLDLRLAG